MFHAKTNDMKGEKRKRKMDNDNEPVFLSEISFYLALERTFVWLNLKIPKRKTKTKKWIISKST